MTVINYNECEQQKAKPVAKQGRKATGLFGVGRVAIASNAMYPHGFPPVLLHDGLI
jgi:hypothetical protein